MQLLLLCLLVAALLGAWYLESPFSSSIGEPVKNNPEQTLLTAPEKVIEMRGWTMTPLARFSIRGRILSIAWYSGELIDVLSPFDFTVGWGPMSDTAVLQKLEITQDDRFYHWRYWGDQPPIPESAIISHSANVHIIPANDTEFDRLRSFHVGSLIHLKGYLVEANHAEDDYSWRSSLKRENTGDGACEVMYVQSAMELWT